MKHLSALKFTFQDRNITVDNEAVLIEDAHMSENLRKTRMLRACLHYRLKPLFSWYSCNLTIFN